jgi:hypothetical protein
MKTIMKDVRLTANALPENADGQALQDGLMPGTQCLNEAVP